jgi:diaminopimelate decarboxylase
MNRMNLRPFRAEFCVDPIILPAAASQSSEKQLPQGNGAGVFLVGGLCSESDLIFRRRLALNALPELEDLFLFPNTAGYLMHHMEIGTHGDGLPANVLLDAETLAVQDSFGKRG